MDPALPGSPSLRYARIETERRFLVRAVPDGVREVSEITDYYLDGTRLRLRAVTTDGGGERPADPPAWLEVIREVTNDEAFTGGGRVRRRPRS